MQNGVPINSYITSLRLENLLANPKSIILGIPFFNITFSGFRSLCITLFVIRCLIPSMIPEAIAPTSQESKIQSLVSQYSVTTQTWFYVWIRQWSFTILGWQGRQLRTDIQFWRFCLVSGTSFERLITRIATMSLVRIECPRQTIDVVPDPIISEVLYVQSLIFFHIRNCGNILFYSKAVGWRLKRVLNFEQIGS